MRLKLTIPLDLEQQGQVQNRSDGWSVIRVLDSDTRELYLIIGHPETRNQELLYLSSVPIQVSRAKDSSEKTASEIVTQGL